MKQVLNSFIDGSVSVIDTPAPTCLAGGVLIASNTSLISPGTEKMLVDFGKSSYLTKAYKNPDRVKQVFNKVRTDGIISTLESIKAKLDSPIPLGYCNSGIVIESGCSEFKVGERVISNGPHAEIVTVPKHLVAKIPDNVENETAVFTVMGSISLQGIRLSKPTMGETFFVMGLGLVGLLTVQLLKANGCKVICSDLNQKRIDLAEDYGAIGINQSELDHDQLYDLVSDHTSGFGVDGVIIATATSSNEPIQLAAKICRKLGRIILIGTAGLSINRSDFYEKEIKFQVSCSYGPGRYDLSYEKSGIDYPYAYVRWTEQRNFQAILELMHEEKLITDKLITHRYNISEGEKAIGTLFEDYDNLGILIKYPGKKAKHKHEIIEIGSRTEDLISVGWIGAGNYAVKSLIPNFKKNGCNLEIIASKSGLTAAHNAKKFGFTSATNDTSSIFQSKKLNTIVITTTHDSHSQFIISALQANKHVFCEKPLCISIDQLRSIQEIKSQKRDLQLMIGFNRRFAPLIRDLKDELKLLNASKTIIMTINAGQIDKSHWIHDPTVGGGRLIGEACHFIDLAIHLSGSKIIEYSINRTEPKLSTEVCDNFIINLKFEDGSICQINYLTHGSKIFPKERIEVFCEGRIYQINNFLNLIIWNKGGRKKRSTWRQDKGQKALVKAFSGSLRASNNQIIKLDEIYQSAEVAIALNQFLKR